MKTMRKINEGDIKNGKSSTSQNYSTPEWMRCGGRQKRDLHEDKCGSLFNLNNLLFFRFQFLAPRSFFLLESISNGQNTLNVCMIY